LLRPSAYLRDKSSAETTATVIGMYIDFLKMGSVPPNDLDMCKTGGTISREGHP
jgi:hypothetical protein